MKSVKKVLVFLMVLVLSVGCFKVMPVWADSSLLTITKTYGDGPFSIKVSSKGKVTYTSGNKKVVTVSSAGKVTIKGCGKTEIKINAASSGQYKANSSKVTIIVKPVKQKITALNVDKRNITVKWNEDKNGDGYYIYYSTDYKFNNDVNKVKVSKKKTTSKTIKNLKAGKKYYVKVCSFKKSGKDIVLGDFSSIRSIKVSK